MDGKKQIAAVVRDYIARERISREQFAFKTRLGKSTVDKFLTGLFSDRTLVVVEEHTKLALRPMLAGTAPKRSEATERPADGASGFVIGRPTIAVLALENMSGDPDQEYFADGIAEDIITALSKLRSFFVVARNSSFSYKGRAVE